MRFPFRPFRFLAIVVLPVVLLVFIQLRANFLIGFWQSAWRHAYSWQTFEHEVFLTRSVREDINAPFTVYDSLFKSFTKEPTPAAFRKWIQTEASQHPLISGAAIWLPNSDSLEVFPIKAVPDSAAIRLFPAFLRLHYSLSSGSEKGDSLEVEIGRHIGFKSFGAFDRTLKLEKERLKSLRFVLLVFWDMDVYRNTAFPEIAKKIGAPDYWFKVPIYSWLTNQNGNTGILILDAKGDTVFAVGSVDTTDKRPMLGNGGSRGMDYLPGWRRWIQNRDAKGDAEEAVMNNYDRRVDGLAFRQENEYQTAARTLATHIYKPLEPRAYWYISMLLLVEVLFLGLDLVRERNRNRAFLAHIAHEFRTPIAKARLFAESLQEGRTASPEQEREYLTNLLIATDQLNGLVENTLNMARLDAGGLKVEAVEGSLSQFMRGFHLRMSSLYASDGASISLSLPEKEITAKFDPTMLELALRNLVDNAVKYSPAAKTIDLQLNEAGKFVEILVEDRGEGIPWRHRSSIFTPFYRISRKGREPVPGAGVGLAVVKAIIRGHRGQVRCEAREGGGSRFVIRLKALQ